MCGIAGFVSAEPEGSRAILARMAEVIAHRGPDDRGFFHDNYAHLAHLRLSIVDLATGHQPMTSETGRRWLIYNGEIFNHAPIRDELMKAGHDYKTASDSETILHAYEEYGPYCVQKLRGMFAFAIWDADSQTLYCARDRFGKKPFYYYWDGRLFAFASEIKALLEHPAITPALATEQLGEYLAFGYCSGEETLFAGIRKLMPGHFLTVQFDRGRPILKIEQYWDIPEPRPIEGRSDADWIAELRSRLEESVRMRLMADVPLGMFLSGGVDSSLIAALMKGMVAEKIQTFAVGYSTSGEEASYSELGFARRAAEAIGTEHHEIRVSMGEYFDALPKLIWHEDEPITWPGSVSLYFVSKLAAERVKVVLTGEGSDELFAGYARYGHHLRNESHMRVWRNAPASLRRRVRERIASTRLLSASSRRKLKHTVLGREDSVESLLIDNFYGPFSAEERKRLGAAAAGDAYANFLGYWNRRRGSSLLSQMLYADQKTYLVELLMKQDQMSMACSLESRVPFLDHELAHFAWTMPDDLKLRSGIGKWVLKKAAEGLVPNEIIYRPKMGFSTPIGPWLRSPEARPFFRRMLDRDGLLTEYLDRSAVETLLEQHQAGQEDATDRIWNLLNLQIWGDLFLSGRRGEAQKAAAAESYSLSSR